MKSLRIVAISDTNFQSQVYQKMVDKLEPNIIVLAGDCNEIVGGNGKYFYDFLQHIAKKSKVLVIKGNHDDSEGAQNYSIKKINGINGCAEISGKSIRINGLKFLGIDYKRGIRNASLLPLLEKEGSEIDVIISHGEISKVRRFVKLKPLIVINGHTMGGVYSVDGIPVVMSNNIGLSLIEIKQNKVKKINEYQIIYEYGLWYTAHPSIKNSGNYQTVRISNKKMNLKTNKKNYEWLNKPSYKTFKKYFIPYQI